MKRCWTGVEFHRSPMLDLQTLSGGVHVYFSNKFDKCIYKEVFSSSSAKSLANEVLETKLARMSLVISSMS